MNHARQLSSTTVELSIGEGRVRAPAPWRNLIEKDLVREGALTLGGPTVARRLAAPRSQISLMLLPRPITSPESTLLAMVEAMRQRVAGVKLKERGTFAFDDGTAGVEVVLEVAPVPSFRATQIHVITGDGAHLFANIPFTAGASGVDEARAIIASFVRPLH